MVDFKTKLITLAGIATMFAGLAHGQVTSCTVASANAVFVAAEGTNEQVADVTLQCISGAATGTTLNLTVYMSPSVAITSATLGSGNSAKSETLAGFGSAGTPLTGAVSGTVSGSSVSFSGIPLGANTTNLITITNIKINASQIATSTGAPTAVQETIFIGGTQVTPGVVGPANVAFATNGLSGIKTSQLAGTSGNGIGSIQICSGATAFPGNNYNGFNVVFGEGFATAFRTQGAAVSGQANTGNQTYNQNLGDEFTKNTYTGYGFAANGTTNQATSGTRVQVVFNNIPAGVTVYVPLTVSYTDANNVLQGQIQFTSSATGAYSTVTGTTANGTPGSTAGNNAGNGTYTPLSVSNGSGTAVYEVVKTSVGAQETYTVPVILQAAGAAVTAPSSAITATVSFAPIGATSNVPNFVSGSSTATVNGNSFSACSTTLLFPFVTNQLGFDTGLAISNTSSDLLNGGTKSNAALQSGSCTLTFFGNTAPAAITTASITAGTTYAAAASTLAPGFQGYMIANCNFLYGHGFAYVVYNLTQNNGAAMGYLADVINNDRKSTVGAELTTGTASPEQ